MRNTTMRFLTMAALCALVVAPVAQAQPIDRVSAGYDLWQTLGSGATSYSFANQPLPADFFCAGSKAFTGRIDFEGVPMGGSLGSTDTIIERLGTAEFDAEGVARTRIQARALNLVGSQKIATPCGAWKVAATLANRQPVSTMTLYRTRDNGGVFDADLRIAVKLVFTNEATGERHQLVREMYLPTYKSTVYTCVQPAEPVGTNTASLLAARDAALTDFTARTEGRTGMRTKETVTGYGGAVIDTGAKTPRRLTNVSDNCIVGYECNPQRPNECLYVYSWHVPELDEAHFTSTPCDLGYQQFCDDDHVYEAEPSIRTGLEQQLDELRELGYITRPTGEVLERQSRIRR